MPPLTKTIRFLRSFKKLSLTDKKRVLAVLERFESNHFGSATALTGGGFRLRAGQLRIIYHLENGFAVLDDVLPRDKVYKK